MKTKQVLVGFVLLALLAGAAQATPILIAIDRTAFSGSESLIDFGTQNTHQPINGVTLGGVTFGFKVDGFPSLDAQISISPGPGPTNNCAPAYIEGNSRGILSLVFPQAEQRFGFGYAISTAITQPVSNATTIELFDAANVSLGSLGYTGRRDPNFVGGFAGVQSQVPFTRAEVSFNATAAPRFAVDNARFEPIPEPSTLALLFAGGSGALFCGWRRWAGCERGHAAPTEWPKR